MRISVEISSYNRGPILRLVLERLAAQTLPADQFEVVVSDDGSDDGTLEWLRDFARGQPYQCTIIENTHGGCGPAHNQGIRRAQAPIVLMLADDVLPTPEVLARHLATHEVHPEPTTVVVGRLVQSPQLPGTAFQDAWNSIVNAMFPQQAGILDYRDFWVSNISFKKEFMLTHGMFMDWPAASHEDVELGYRLQRQGMQLLFCPEALAYHHHPETIDTVARRAYAHGYNWHRLEGQVPDFWVRARSGNFVPGDDFGQRLGYLLRNNLRGLLFNDKTVPQLAVPLVRAAERSAWLVPLLPFVVGKVAAYFFRKGLLDHRRGLPSRSP